MRDPKVKSPYAAHGFIARSRGQLDYILRDLITEFYPVYSALIFCSRNFISRAFESLAVKLINPLPEDCGDPRDLLAFPAREQLAPQPPDVTSDTVNNYFAALFTAVTYSINARDVSPRDYVTNIRS